MSTCISRHGEYSDHTLNDGFTCTLCGAVDDDAMRAALDAERARAEWLAPTVAALEAEVARLTVAEEEARAELPALEEWREEAESARDAQRARADAAEAVIERVRGLIPTENPELIADGYGLDSRDVLAALSDAAPQAVACTCGGPTILHGHASTCPARFCQVTGARDCGCRPTPDATDGREGA